MVGMVLQAQKRQFAAGVPRPWQQILNALPCGFSGLEAADARGGSRGGKNRPRFCAASWSVCHPVWSGQLRFLGMIRLHNPLLARL